MTHFEFNIWCFYWLLIGIAMGSTIMFFLNRKDIKKLRFQMMSFIEIITKLSVKYCKLNDIANRLIAINKEILNKR